MAKNDYESPDPDDLFSDTRMSFGDHIDDLRTHLLRALWGFLGGMFVAFFLSPYVMQIIIAPVEDQLNLFEQRVQKEDRIKAQKKGEGTLQSTIKGKFLLNRDDLRAGMSDRQPDAPPPPPTSEKILAERLDQMVYAFENLLSQLDATQLLEKDVLERGHYVEVRMEIPNPQILSTAIYKENSLIHRKRVSTMNITEAFMVYFKITILTGLVISSPWVFYHVWAFIAAGLFPHEKKLVNVYLPFSLFLFLSGVLICQFLVMPRAIEAMLWFNEWLGLAADLRLNEWLSFALMMPLVFGIAFQTPLVMMALHRVGVVTVQTYRDKRRISWFLMAVVAAIIMPTPDAVSMLFLWVPMGGLYELGILLCVWQGDQPSLFDWDEEEKKKSGELVEV